MTANFSNPESLGVLTSTVNQTLIETGKFFRSSGSMQSRAQLRRSIPVAHDQFQLALDNLSEQIFIAKAFLERDYEAIKATKAESQPVADVAMGEDQAVPEEKPEPENAETTDAVKTEPQTADENATAQASAVRTQEPTDQPVKTEPEENTENKPPGQTEELNFDSMLNDTGGANDFDLNLDFGDDDLGNKNFLSGNLGSNLGNTASEAHNGNEKDQSSALDMNNPDNTATGGDAFDMEFQKTDGMGNNPEDVMAPGESSFDDLFMDTENFGGDGMGDQNLLGGDGLMNINEIDDNWFN